MKFLIKIKNPISSFSPLSFYLVKFHILCNFQLKNQLKNAINVFVKLNKNFFFFIMKILQNLNSFFKIKTKKI